MGYENHDGFDFFCVSDMNRKPSHTRAARAYVYLRKNLILIFGDPPAFAEKTCAEMECAVHTGFDRLLSSFFERLTADDAAALEKIEQEISALENALITSKKRDCVKEIISLRKRLMGYKRYYEQLLLVLDELQENGNGLMPGGALRYFKIYAGRVDRLYHSVINLRDYVTQVREAYQAEVDIGLNHIMKLFTVLTAIFMPLTLLVGWYGMNLQMPEFQWAFGYPMVIIVAVAITAVCLFVFKRKKWF
jgi:magnesium transporter